MARPPWGSINHHRSLGKTKSCKRRKVPSLACASLAEARADQLLLASWATPAMQKPIHRMNLRRVAEAPTINAAGFAAYLADTTK
jgi:hypothetical protein